MAHIAYRLEVTVTQRLSDDPDDPDYPTLEGATTAAWKRRLERDVAALLYRLKGYGQAVTNVEVMFALQEGQ